MALHKVRSVYSPELFVRELKVMKVNPHYVTRDEQPLYIGYSVSDGDDVFQLIIPRLPKGFEQLQFGVRAPGVFAVDIGGLVVEGILNAMGVKDEWKGRVDEATPQLTTHTSRRSRRTTKTEQQEVSTVVESQVLEIPLILAKGGSAFLEVRAVGMQSPATGFQTPLPYHAPRAMPWVQTGMTASARQEYSHLLFSIVVPDCSVELRKLAEAIIKRAEYEIEDGNITFTH